MTTITVRPRRKTVDDYVIQCDGTHPLVGPHGVSYHTGDWMGGDTLAEAERNASFHRDAWHREEEVELTVGELLPRPWPRHDVVKVDDRTWLVPSKSTPGDYHTVAGHYAEKEGAWFTCSCRAGREKGRMNAPRYEPACAHVRLANLAESDDGYPKRPSPPPNVGALVD